MTSSGCHYVDALTATARSSLVAMVTVLCRHLTIRRNHGIQCVPCFSRIISEMLLEIHTMEKFDFPNSIIHSQIFEFSVYSVKIFSWLNVERMQAV